MADVLPNLRDVGGIGALDGSSVRTGRLLRSAAPAAEDVTPHGIVWPPRTVIDLRSAMESGDQHPLAASGARIVNTPLLSALRPGVALASTLAELYKVVLDTAPHLLIDVVRAAAGSDGAALVHCAAGKDRTGIAVAFMLRLVGADRDDVVDDYLLTEKHYDAIQARLSVGPGSEHRAKLPAEFFTTPVGAITGVLDLWDSHPEGTVGWFLQAGGTADDLESLRGHLLGDTIGP